ncbi:MAG: NADPH:quinone reductase [Myxococcales bacterium]|nr:NADPH:quinone reductase [Myxococcales bacterium]
MIAAFYERRGPAREVLRVGELPEPEPGPGEVRVRVRASAVNPTDTKSRKSPAAMQFPRVVPHQDGAGIIDRVGSGVSADRIGERVWIYEAQWQRPHGTAAQFTVVPREQAVPLPDHVSFEEGACLGIPAMTAHACVFSDGDIAGKTVLVTGGTGAVGWYAVQLAQLAGARVIATVGNEKQERQVRDLGIEQVIDRRAPDLARRIGTVDHIVEVAFGANLPVSAEVIAPSGVIATYASDGVSEPPLPFRPFLLKNVTVRFLLIYLVSAERHRAAARDIGAHLAARRLRHSIVRRFPLAEIASAHEAMEAGHLDGKVIIEIA